MRLSINRYSKSLYFRGFTNKLDKSSLKTIASMGKIEVVIDLTKHPDIRWKEFVKFIPYHIPEGHTANIMKMEHLAENISEMVQTKNVLVVSYFGKNRAPTICAMVDPSNAEELKKSGMPTMEFFRSLM